MSFWSMGGDGAYVWSAYGITLAVLVFNYWSARRQLRLNLERLRDVAQDHAAPRQPTVRKL